MSDTPKKLTYEVLVTVEDDGIGGYLPVDELKGLICSGQRVEAGISITVDAIQCLQECAENDQFEYQSRPRKSRRRNTKPQGRPACQCGKCPICRRREERAVWNSIKGDKLARVQFRARKIDPSTKP